MSADEKSDTMLGASWEQTLLSSASGGTSGAEPLALPASAAPFNFVGEEQ